MPKRILIIGLLFCLSGILAIWEILSGLMESHVNLNFSVLMLPVGIGLLRGRETSRKWAIAWIYLGYAFCALLVLLSLSGSGVAKFSLFGMDLTGASAVPYIVIASIVMAIGFRIIHKLLNSPKAREWCAAGGRHH